MARRKLDNLRAKTPQRRKNSRHREPVRERMPDIIIACEDIDSAPTYFKEIVQALIVQKKITQDSFVIAKHQHTHCEGVLEDLKQHKTQQGKGYRDFAHKWIVIDRDAEQGEGQGHTQQDFTRALSESKKLKVEVAYANDCFELWYLLHFETLTAYLSRDDLITRVIVKLKVHNPTQFSALDRNTIKSQAMAKLIYQQILPLQYQAIKRGIKLEIDNQEEDPSTTNPATRIHHLVCLLKTLHLTNPTCEEIKPCEMIIDCTADESPWEETQ